jgi:hypothetical protein
MEWSGVEAAAEEASGTEEELHLKCKQGRERCDNWRGTGQAYSKRQQPLERAGKHTTKLHYTGRKLFMLY